ncbi:MAG TPA: Cof-type HAD-IIB family hydrolase [Corynebacterium kroppenstedtii]|nr:Cof-type HAD-IIB family hydrolase [Corynebacterium kroppenstedtii]
MQHRGIMWRDIDPRELDICLVVCDMDGTLLDGDSQLPEGFWEVYRLLTEHNVTFVPASGRQLATLTTMFWPADTGATGVDDAKVPRGEVSRPQTNDFIAENGNLVIHSGERVWQSVIPESIAQEVIHAVRRGVNEGRNLGLVMCAADGAYVDRDDDAFLAEARKYYASLDVVPNVADVEDDFLKFAIYDFDDAEASVESMFGSLNERYRPVVSGQHWIDVMDSSVNKGVALRRLQEALGVTRDQTAVFGDYLNDREMIAEGQYSFAMENAHPTIMKEANYCAPANTEAGVVQVLRHLFDGTSGEH